MSDEVWNWCHDEYNEDCPICRRLKEDPRRRMAHKPTRVTAEKKIPQGKPKPPCKFKDDTPLTHDEKVKFSLPIMKDWRECNNPKRPLGRHVCSCKGCGPKCGEYVPDYEGVILDLGAGGLGDAVQGLCVAAGLASETGKPVRFNCGKSGIPFVELFAAEGVEIGKCFRVHSEDPVPGAWQMNIGYTREREEQLSQPRWERYMTNVGATQFVIPPLKDRDRLLALGSDFAGYIALCPWSTGRWAEWSIQAWVTLERKLHAAGYKTVVLNKTDERIEKFKGEKLIGQSPERVVGVMLNAACTIGIDSGLSHLSGILGVPGIILGGATHVKQIFGCYPGRRFLQGGLHCSGCFHTGPDVNAMCRENCSNIHSVTPERVAVEVDDVCLRQLVGDKSLISTDRLAVIRDAVLATNHLDGDVAELGTYRGGSAKLIARYTRSIPRVLFLDDRPSRWEKFRRVHQTAVWVQTRAEYATQLSKRWDAVFLDFDLCEEVPGDPAEWNGVEAARMLLAAEVGSASVFIHSTNATGGPLTAKTLASGGVTPRSVPFDNGGWESVEIPVTEPTIHLYDTFEGIPEDDAAEGGHHVRGEFACGVDEVMGFVNDPRAVAHVGTFPETAVPDATYRFVHIDGDTFQTTVAALEYFWPRMVPGGIIVLDDVDWKCTPGVRRALDTVLPDVWVETPTRHQGLIRKPTGEESRWPLT